MFELKESVVVIYLEEFRLPNSKISNNLYRNNTTLYIKPHTSSWNTRFLFLMCHILAHAPAIFGAWSPTIAYHLKRLCAEPRSLANNQAATTVV